MWNIRRIGLLRQTGFFTLPKLVILDVPIQAKHGKGRGIKASDAFVIPLCAICHAAFDRFELGSREQSEAMFEKWLVRVNRMLNQTDKEIF